ncbi:MAG: RES family NAD+ phosphorylase [Planctomycetaceae bacterium]
MRRPLGPAMARLYPGRWHFKGHPVVYTAQNSSLAQLEMIANLKAAATQVRFQIAEAIFDEAVINVEIVAKHLLPRDWNAELAPIKLKEIGSEWIVSLRTAVLKVPSALDRTGTEFNYLFNPRHPDFLKINLGQPAPFEFDARLLKSVEPNAIAQPPAL